MPYSKMTHAVDPKKEIWDQLGDISDISLYNTQVMVAIYIRPEKTASGLFLAAQTRDEDKWQGKVGLVIKKGPQAFVEADDSAWFDGVDVEVNDWVYFRHSDAWLVTVHGVLCAILKDVNVRGKVGSPDQVW